jgi:hypothetical protein
MNLNIQKNYTKSLDVILDKMIDSSQAGIALNIQKLKEQNPGISTDELAKKIIRRESIKSGMVGAFTCIGGTITLPVAIPVDLAVTWRIQIILAITIAYLYGYNSKKMDLKTDIYIILAGDAAKEALKQLGINITNEITKRAVKKYITRNVMKKIWKIIPQKIITKAGEKSFINITKTVPVISAPVAYTIDWYATKTVGKFAIKYYSGKG